MHYRIFQYHNTTDLEDDGYFIKTLNDRIKKEKPNVQFGISPFGVWRNYYMDKSGSKTKAGITNYDNLYADTRKWIDKGWIDYIVPQIYWNQGFKPAEYNTLVNWWADEVRGTDVKLYIGQAAYKVGTKGWKDPGELINQVRYNRSVDGVGGSVYFNIDSLIDNPMEIKENMKKTIYKRLCQPKKPPSMASNLMSPPPIPSRLVSR